ncbi:response regulator, partial [Streptosporangium canum]
MIRVLLADDEHLIRGAIATLLGLEPDIEVVAQVARGDLVAQAVRDHWPDVIVLDIEMPGMDGLTVAETLPGHAVLMLSSFGRPGYLRRALA